MVVGAAELRADLAREAVGPLDRRWPCSWRSSPPLRPSRWCSSAAATARSLPASRRRGTGFPLAAWPLAAGRRRGRARAPELRDTGARRPSLGHHLGLRALGLEDRGCTGIAVGELALLGGPGPAGGTERQRAERRHLGDGFRHHRGRAPRSSALAGRFAPTWRVPLRSAVAAIVGGLLLGYGARLAYGCNIGAYFSGIASGSLHGWAWLVAAFAGNVLGTRIRPLFGLEVERTPRADQLQVWQVRDADSLSRTCCVASPRDRA